MSFNLSMVAAAAPQGEVKASPQANLVKDPKDGEMKPQTVTDGGITIDKSKAPEIRLDGPVGYMYTELLNRELSNESMAAVVHAAMDAQQEDPATPGKVAMTPNGPVVERANPNAGYVFVTKGDDLQPADVMPIMDKVLNARRLNPDMPVGVAMITDGRPSATMESLSRCLAPSGIQVTYLESGLTDMVRRMAKAGK